jgi:hypothetical protein
MDINFYINSYNVNIINHFPQNKRKDGNKQIR